MDSIGDRMKNNYELPYQIKLPERMPVIIRLDGKAFHSFTKHLQRPFDDVFIAQMQRLALHLVGQIQNARFAYVQSDEISILMVNYNKLTSQSWMNNEVQKMCSISSGIASSWFSIETGRDAIFDSRVFIVPEAEVCNYFIWRQQDWTRNSIQMLARSLYSHRECENKNGSELQEMCFQKGHNWNDLAPHLRRGSAVEKVAGSPRIILDIPIFTQDRRFVECNLNTEE